MHEEIGIFAIYIIFVVAPLTLIIAKEIYDRTSHVRYDRKRVLKCDAKIVDINVKIVGLKGSKRYRTTVYFDDGFKFISHKTDIQEHFLSYSISLPIKMQEEIIIDAIEAHGKMVKRRRNNG